MAATISGFVPVLRASCLAPAGTMKPSPAFSFRGRLTFHQQLAFALDDVADLFTRMRVPSDRSSGSDFHVRDDRLAARHRYIGALHHRALNAGILR